MPMFYYYWDPTYILVLVGLLLSLGASAMVNSSMRKYSNVPNRSGITGGEAARRILNNEGLYNVQIECLRDAAHECGHAIQHAKGYAPLNIRSALVPVVNIGSTLSMPLIFLGVILSWNQVLIQIGIWVFALTVLFQLVTLPVEFNASRRAVEKVEQYGLLTAQEKGGCRKVLTAAAMTYVAAAAAAALQLLRLVLLFGNNRRRD